MKYAVIEDETFARKRLIKTIGNLRPDMELVYEGVSVVETINFLKSKPDLDLMFMDVELSDGNCFQIFEEIAPSIPIIFTTAFDSYALKAFQTYGIGYVMKPYADEEIESALKKFENLRESSDRTMLNLRSLYESITRDSRPQNKRILTVRGDSFEYINIDEIATFEMKNGLVHIIQKDGSSHLTNFQNLQSVMDIVPKEQFFQVARGLILNIDHIKKVSKYFRGRLIVYYYIADKEYDVIVSDARKQSFLDWFGIC